MYYRKWVIHVLQRKSYYFRFVTLVRNGPNLTLYKSPDEVSRRQHNETLKPSWFARSWSKLSSRFHDDVIKWKHFPRYWPFVRGIHQSPVNSPHKGWWRGALMFSVICAWINGWVNNHEAWDLRHHQADYDVTLMLLTKETYTVTQISIYSYCM